jgi:hypothetical protein
LWSAAWRFPITHQLVEVGCASCHLGERPVADGGAESRHIHLLEEIAEG